MGSANRNQGGGAGGAGGGGKVAVAMGPPHQVLDTHRNRPKSAR